MRERGVLLRFSAKNPKQLELIQKWTELEETKLQNSYKNLVNWINSRF